MAQKSRGLMKGIYGALSLFSKDVSPEALAFDHKASKIITIIAFPRRSCCTATSASSSAR